MKLDEFKFIYWMEYAHRMWGRVLGVMFAGPALYFAGRGWINAPLGRRLGLLFLMGGGQGLVGWWMVRSGLQVRVLVEDCFFFGITNFGPSKIIPRTLAIGLQQMLGQ
jgi:heme A synthase